MIFLYKYNGRKCCYDQVSGAVISLSALQYKMMGTLEPPLPPQCPTSLRYELAKYDSEDVNEAYEELYALFSEGLIFGVSDADTAVIRISGEYAVSDAGEADMIFAFAHNSGMSKCKVLEGILPEDIRFSAEKNGLTL